MTTKFRAGLALASLAGALVGLVITVPAAAAPSTIPTTHIAITNFSFSPTPAFAPLGGVVSWTNNDMVAHTSTSDQGFWGSPSINPGTSWARRFTTAGTFAYHCAIHPDMRAILAIRLRVAPVTHGAVVTWAVSAGRFDVQFQKPGSARWLAYRTGTLTRAVTFRSTHLGRYHFRARTHIGSTASGWSPSSVVVVR